jgi:cell division septum initiation protein DivIVA
MKISTAYEKLKRCNKRLKEIFEELETRVEKAEKEDKEFMVGSG